MDELIRAQLHEALDVERPDPSLRYRVIAAAHPDLFHQTGRVARRPARNAFGLTLRGAAGLVATVLVILLIGITLSGGRLMRDWNALVHNSAPAGVGINQSELHQLEAIPLQLPILAAGADCPVGPASNVVGYGGDPVSGIGYGNVSRGLWDFYFQANFVLRSGYKNIVLIRGRSLTSGKLVVFVGAYAAGPVVGTDVVDGRRMSQANELVLDPSNPPSLPAVSHLFNSGDGRGYVDWQVTYGVTSLGRDSDCVGWQVDSLEFPSQTFVTPASMFEAIR